VSSLAPLLPAATTKSVFGQAAIASRIDVEYAVPPRLAFTTAAPWVHA
jgi:hypothetical protein